MSRRPVADGQLVVAMRTAIKNSATSPAVKAQATKALTAMGLSVSDAVRVFLSTRRARFATAEDLFDDLAKKRK